MTNERHGHRSDWPARWRKISPARRVAAGMALALLITLWWTNGSEARAAIPTWPHREILDAIRWVESSDRENPPDGDDGRAIGPYQIHEIYWRDALAADPSIGGNYQDCRKRAYAERVIEAYMLRYVPEDWRAGDGEVIARVHNGGPRGYRKNATLGYWRRVLERLTK